MQLRKARLSILLCLTAFVLVVLPACFQNQPASKQPSTFYTSRDTPQKPEAPRIDLPPGSLSAPKPKNPAEARTPTASADTARKTNSSNEVITAAAPPQKAAPKQYSGGRTPPAAPPSEESIQQQMERLAKALFFHNIPSQIRAGDTYTIEAGVTKKFTQELRQQLQGQRTVTIRGNVRYDPKGVDIQLKVNPDDFRVKEVTVGKRPPIVDGKPNIWKWEITPLRQGKRNLSLISVININVPGSVFSYEPEFTLYRETVDVRVNLGYSVQQFVANYWQPVLINFFALFAGGFAWFKALQFRRSKGKAQYPQS